MKSPNLQFVWGVLVGIVIVFASFAAVSGIAGVKWQPIVIQPR